MKSLNVLTPDDVRDLNVPYSPPSALPSCTLSQQHSSPIPIPTPSPAETPMTDIALGPSRDGVIPNGIVIPNGPSATTICPRPLSVQQMKRLQNYRSHSFKRTSLWQWAAMVGGWAMIISFAVILLPAFPKWPDAQSTTLQCAWTGAWIVYPALFVVVLVFYVILSATDSGLRPTVTGMAKEDIAGDGSKFWCYLCEEARCKGTKHCYSCRKCVDGFDHHCPFLNTCIGQRNYAQFITFSAAFETLSLLQVTYCLSLSLRSYQPINKLSF